MFRQSSNYLSMTLRAVTRSKLLSCSIGRGLASSSLGREEEFLSGTSAAYIEEMFEAYKRDPQSVHVSWRAYFSAGRYRSPHALISGVASEGDAPLVASNLSQQTIDSHHAVQSLIRSFQARGHNVADLDPLNIAEADLDKSVIKELELNYHNLNEADLGREFTLPATTFVAGDERRLPLRKIVERLRNAYCGSIGVEYMHLNNIEQVTWIRRNVEAPGSTFLTNDQKKMTLKRLVRAAGFEEFLAYKFPSEKRFGLEGCEVLIPSLKTVIDRSSEIGVQSFILGMPHRGRLNVLANVARMPLEYLFTAFASNLNPDDEGSGDVKYHLGASVERLNTQTQKMTKLAIVANPSHLEAVDPIVQGKTRAQQFYRGDKHGDQVMSILLHGDAAFSGQGVVYETFHLSELPQYTTHGTIHIVVNNQIGFTTDPRFSRSSPYCTDVARVVNAPIFHVNADDPEAVAFVSRLAAEWRATFHKDVVIDLVCYRRFGHNEIDEPSFTQPIMYKKIRGHTAVRKLYADKLVKDKVVDEKWVEDELKSYRSICEAAFEKARGMRELPNRLWLDSHWDGWLAKLRESNHRLPDTGVDTAILQRIGEVFGSVPENSKIHKRLEATLNQRREMLNMKKADWAMGEAFAFGSLLKEGVHVRLSGQDVERGTFSHRHHILHDQEHDKHRVSVLNAIFPDQAPYTVCNSSLSEFGVLGFELGFSMENPRALVCWEAQFGDFMNTAQCIIDQFISCGQTKWHRQAGLVLLLPHGYEGMGPEHSSARLERFLQSSDDDEDACPALEEMDKPEFAFDQLLHGNWLVVNCSTPANYFHVLRRQIMLPFRKPLVIMTPKSLLRLKEALSPIDDMLPGTQFQRVITDSSIQDPSSVKKLIFCSGKVYYDLVKRREKEGLQQQIAIVRVEQLSPFPYDLLRHEFVKYGNAQAVWLQEEHKNMGAYSYVKPRFQALLKRMGDSRANIGYAGRPAAASTATGNKYVHNLELENLQREAMRL